ncbi:hypothetical protein B0I35DRAFT_136879 [Stachybotrys elegans]|uniref:Uncharacterized protein n=1 Tax=Stachybotrys elegans TaxID=80388 RepID=A0A8K0WX31_9HYPO|nr:hypothetical protein B0I35DRAFT_136879 [Stachybotrys elegans]
MDPRADLDILPHPAMSAAKQNRIMIWRNEVASALDPLEADSVNDIAPSSTAASTITSHSSSSTAASPPVSRPRSLWNRVSRRLSIFTRSSDAADADPIRSPRTAMYRDMVDPIASPSGPEAKRADEMLLGADSDEGRPGGLKEKQERLERAARLLDQGRTPA